MVKVNLHIHSNYSDGFYPVEVILKNANKRNLKYIAITDHNEIRGSLKAVEKSKEFGVDVVPGIEIFFLYNNRIVELLVYFKETSELKKFYNDFIGNRLLPIVKEPKNLNDLIKRFNGYVIQPHPLSVKGCLHNKFRANDFLETKNPMARDMMFPTSKKQYGGADLHLWMDSLNCYTEFSEVNSIEDIFTVDNRSIPVNNFHITYSEKFLQALVNSVLITKFLIIQFVRKKFLGNNQV